MSRVLTSALVRVVLLLFSAALATFAVGCSDSNSNPVSPDSRSTPVAQLALSVTVDTGGSAVALPGVSEVKATVSVRTDASVAAYSVNYGDGFASSDANSGHVYQAPGTYTIDASAVLRSGQVVRASTSVQVKAFTGAFYVGDFNPRTGRFEVRKVTIDSQSGRTLQVRWVPAGQVAFQSASGEIQGERHVSIAAENGAMRLDGAVPSRVVIGENETLDLQVAQSPDGSLTGTTLKFRSALDVPGTASAPPQLIVQAGSTSASSGITGFSQMNFSVNGSIDSTAMYAMEFGDGGSAFGTAVTRPCGPRGSYLARVSVLDRAARLSTATAPYSCSSLVNSYGWYNSFQNTSPNRYESRTLTFAVQNGTTAQGSYRHPEGNVSPFHASGAGDQSIRITLDDGSIDFTGTVETTRLHLTVRGGSADGRTLDFTAYDPY